MCMLIRRFSPSDVQSITQIVKRSLGETYPPSLYLTLHNLWSDGFLVLEDGGRVLGFVAAVESEKGVARVLMLAIAPEHRRRTLGSALMNELYVRCRESGHHTVRLEVRRSNSAALSFYEAHGFTVTGELTNFYLNGEGAYQMTKVLQT